MSRTYSRPTSSVNTTSKSSSTMMDREDGELSDEVDDIDTVDYTILPRPQNPVPSVTPEVPHSLANAASLDYSDDDQDDLKDEDTDSDSDADTKPYRPNKQSTPGGRVMSAPFRNPNAPMLQGAPPIASSPVTTMGTGMAQRMNNFQAKRKPFNAWGEMLEKEKRDETLQGLDNIDVVGNSIMVSRGAESYTYIPGQTSARKRKLDQKKKSKTFTMTEDDIGSSGLSDDDLEYIKGKPGARKVPSISNFGEGFETCKTMTVSEVSKHLETLKQRQLCFFIANELTEKKVQLIFRTHQILGRKCCIRLFLKTFKIEKMGGLMTKNMQRRRTPGGVFMYMLRKDDSLDPEKRDAVFRDDRIATNRERKQLKAKRYRENKAKMEAKLKQGEGAAEPGAEEDGELPSGGEDDDQNDSDMDSDEFDIDDDDVLDVSIRTNEFDAM